MMPRTARLAALTLPLVLAGCSGFGSEPLPDGGLGFFVTSVGSGRGADFGGLAGADEHCRRLASAVGAGDRPWRAYLSTRAVAGAPAVNARDRIGRGPWLNAQGAVIAGDVAELHGANNLTKLTALDERGRVVNGLNDTPNLHAILTGSRPDGTLMPGDTDTTCRNWTSSTDGAAMVGHHDRMGLDDTAAARSWNASKLTRGCSPQALAAIGSGGLLYCFAAR